MKVVLLSGGAGKRLWPMSNDTRSKQFLRVLRDEHGNSISMLQRVWSQLAEAGLQRDTFICAAKAQHEMIESQLGPVPLITEPSRRDTFPAIALSTSYLSELAECEDDEVVVVMPVDPFVHLHFFHTLRQLDGALLESGAELALMGVRPTEPTSKFGYIRIDDTKSSGVYTYFPVHSFVEKPARQAAAQMIEDGALWNCGVFAFRIGSLKKRLAEGGYPLTYRELLAQFHSLPKRSFDYEVVEHVNHAVVIPYYGSWDDLGSWGALSEQMDTPMVGPGVAVGCENTHVINEMGVPVVAMGLQDLMVVSTPDGILVADKELAAEIKNVTGAWEGRPMYEERLWGFYRVLDYQKLPDGSEALTKYVEISPDRYISYQKHKKRTEVWTILEGCGEVILNSTLREVQAGDVLRISPGEWHGIYTEDGLKMIEIQRGTELSEDDIVRSFTSWEETLDYRKAEPLSVSL